MHLLPVWLSLDACSIIRLATLVLAVAICAYLLSRKGKSRATLFLGLTFCGAALFAFSSLVEFAGRYYWQPRNLKNLMVPLLQDASPTLILVSLVLFAYYFPRLPKAQRREARIVLTAVLAVGAGMFALTVYNFLFLERRLSRFHFTITYYTLLYASVGVQVALVVFLLLRRAVSLSGGKSRPWWLRLARPQGRHASTARALAVNMVLLAVAVVVYVLMTYGLLAVPLATYLIWLAFLLFHCVFVVTYLNHSAEAATIQVKLIGLTLIPVFALLGLIAVLLGKFSETDYRHRALPPSQWSIRFSPNAQGSYDIEGIPYSVAAEMGQRLEIQPEGTATVDMQFDFPFFRRVYRCIQVLHGPMIYLGEELEETGWGGYRPNPAIAPVIMNLDPTRGGGVLVDSGPLSCTVTWLDLPEVSLRNDNTIQLTLYEDGAFIMSFVRLDPQGRYSSVQMYNHTTATTTGLHPGARGAPAAFGPRLTGIHPGGSDRPHKPLRFDHDLPYRSPRPEVIFDSYEADYAAYLHDRISLLAVILLASGLLVLFLFPRLFQANLIRPLHALADGMRQADAGDLGVKVRPQFRDEVGFLTRSFNRMLHSLRKHEDSLRMVAENVQEGLLILREGVPVYANRRMQEISGYATDELDDSRLAELFGARSELIAAGREGQPVECLLISKAGTGVPAELTWAQTIWDGRPAEVIVLRDISRRKKSEERVRERDRQLMQANKLTTLGVLLSAMAHQLTTPSRSILQDLAVLGRAAPGLGSILDSLGQDDAGLLIAGVEISEFRRLFPRIIDEIERNAKRIEAIVRELQSFGREDPFPVLASMQVHEVIRSAVELTSGHLSRATDRFAVELEPQLPPVHGSAHLIEQVIVNLLMNACQALGNRGQGITLRSRLSQQGGEVVIEVQDEGVGIPPENLDRLGERFYTTRRAAGGSGLGLYVARTIVARHGGSLVFTSRPGSGTLAVVSLPAEAPPAEEP